MCHESRVRHDFLPGGGLIPRTAVIVAVVLLGATCRMAVAADLQERTAEAYATYLQEATSEFLARVDENVADPPTAGVLSAGPAREDGIIGVPGGLVHNWVATAFARGASIERVLQVSRQYADYRTVYTSVVASRLLDREDDTYHVVMRLEGGEAGVHAVLDVRSTVHYAHPSERTAYAISTSDEIRQVEDAGRPDERLLPPGHDSGYLWRAATFTRFVALEDGVFIEMETLGLSRRFPFLLGWIIEPIARRLGRKSVEMSLREFLAALSLS